ncbi:MAG: 2Fe-2S iron-sulfur cluster-binding protein, partial [Candidatus Omnitrophota bacterium]|nr:2Fe-2S iron-sulfur cluster-binding protein [Candidatus Omnitrophota bacterium]
MQKFKVTFLPDHLTITVEKDKSILAAAISAGIYLNSNCAGDGTCGRCKVVVNQGQVESQPNGIITAQEKKNNVYLACLAAIQSDLEILIPDSSRMDADIQTDSLRCDDTIEPGDTLGKNFGLFFDIGTTTISGQLVNLNSKKILGTKTAYNRQAAFGSDVITRIIYAA